MGKTGRKRTSFPSWTIWYKWANPWHIDRLYQSDKSRSTNGNGLGLAIVKELVHLHKGTIYAENSLSGGTVFIIKLPKAL